MSERPVQASLSWLCPRQQFRMGKGNSTLGLHPFHERLSWIILSSGIILKCQEKNLYENQSSLLFLVLKPWISQGSSLKLLQNSCSHCFPPIIITIQPRRLFRNVFKSISNQLNQAFQNWGLGRYLSLKLHRSAWFLPLVRKTHPSKTVVLKPFHVSESPGVFDR